MAITKETQIGKIEMEDSTELSRKYHRHSLMPDADITNEHSEVQAVCNAVWTQDVKDAYATFKAEQQENM
jgi:hypothetical protein